MAPRRRPTCETTLQELTLMTMTGRTRWLALIVLCMGTLMIVLDSTIVNVALPSIRADLHFSQTLAGMGRQRVPAHLRRLPPARRPARRPLRPPRRFSSPASRCSRWPRSPAASRSRRSCWSRRAPCRASAARSLGGRPVADHDPVHRAGRAGQGDGRLRLRRVRRRHHRRAARRRADQLPQLALDLPRQPADRRRGRGAVPAPRLLPAGRGSAGARLDVAGALTVTAR